MLIFERMYHPEIVPKGTQKKNYFLQWWKDYIYCVLLNLNIVHVIKVIVGEPRPHFFDTCRPQEALTCQGYVL